MNQYDRITASGKLGVHIFAHTLKLWERRLIRFAKQAGLLQYRTIRHGDKREFPALSMELYFYVGNRCWKKTRANMPPMQAIYAEWLLTR